jgi:8-oxo-dGTP pyrophosphatase MutT (NUDIX family)
MPIRAKAIAIVVHEGRLLVGKAVEETETFYCPLGGGVEHGEYGADAVRREMMEEIGAVLDEVTLLGMMENIFTFRNTLSHELVLLYHATLADPTLYALAEIGGDENGTPFTATWEGLESFTPQTPLYPEGLLEFLAERGILLAQRPTVVSP